MAQSSSSSSISPTASSSGPENFCEGCLRKGSELPDGQKLKNCGGCQRVSYCDKECQRKDWKEHKKWYKHLAAGEKQEEYISANISKLLSRNAAIQESNAREIPILLRQFADAQEPTLKYIAFHAIFKFKGRLNPTENFIVLLTRYITPKQDKDLEPGSRFPVYDGFVKKKAELMRYMQLLAEEGGGEIPDPVFITKQALEEQLKEATTVGSKNGLPAIVFVVVNHEHPGAVTQVMPVPLPAPDMRDVVEGISVDESELAPGFNTAGWLELAKLATSDEMTRLATNQLLGAIPEPESNK